MSDFISVGAAPGVPLEAFAGRGEVRHLPEPHYLAQDVREAERRGWLYGLGEVWQITEAGWMHREAAAVMGA